MLEKYLIAFLDHQNVHVDINFVTLAKIEAVVYSRLNMSRTIV